MAQGPDCSYPDGELTELQVWKPKLEEELDNLDVGAPVTFHLSNGAQVSGALIGNGPGYARIKEGRREYLVQLDHVAVLEL